MKDESDSHFLFSESTKPNSKLKIESTSSSQQTPSGGLVAPKVDTFVSINLKAFTFSDLKNATKNFRPESILGEGGFGWVFKGWIDGNTFAPAKPGSGMVVAVKKLKRESFQGHKEWLVRLLWIPTFLQFCLINPYMNLILFPI